MSEDDQKMLVSPRELRELLQEEEDRSAFLLAPHFRPENIVEIAKSQFPRLEADVAKHREQERTRARVTIHQELERTRRLLIVMAGVCLLVGAALIVFAPVGKEGVSYAVAASLAILSLGAIGVQEFRIRMIGVRLDGGRAAVLGASENRP